MEVRSYHISGHISLGYSLKHRLKKWRPNIYGVGTSNLHRFLGHGHWSFIKMATGHWFSMVFIWIFPSKSHIFPANPITSETFLWDFLWFHQFYGFPMGFPMGFLNSVPESWPLIPSNVWDFPGSGEAPGARSGQLSLGRGLGTFLS